MTSTLICNRSMSLPQFATETRRISTKLRRQPPDVIDRSWIHHSLDFPTSDQSTEFGRLARCQIRQTLALARNLSSGDDLRTWTPKARRALRAGGNVFCIVEDSEKVAQVFLAPKLALLVASPILRYWIVDEPETKEIHFADPRFTAPAIGILCYWLTSICNWSSDATPMLPCPGNIFQALELRHNAQLLCMDKYVQSFDIHYVSGLWERIPSIREAKTVSKRSLDDNDPVLHAWAFRVAHLRRELHLPQYYLDEFNSILTEKAYYNLQHALTDADFVFEINGAIGCQPYRHGMGFVDSWDDFIVKIRRGVFSSDTFTGTRGCR
jgi:hypothetical protein